MVDTTATNPADPQLLPTGVPAGPTGPPAPAKQGQANVLHEVRSALGNPSSMDEQRIVNMVQMLFQEARAYRAPLVQRWLRNYRVLRNRYWSDTRPDWMAHPEVPEVFPVVSSMVGWMTDQRFDLDVFPSTLPFSPYNEEIYRLSEDLETVMDASWHVNNEESQVTVSIWDANIYGTGILKTVWDNTLAGGMGDAITRRVDPFTFYPDPNARSMDDMNYAFEVRRWSVQELDRRFPGAGALFPESYGFEGDRAPDQIGNETSTMPKANPGRINGGVASYGRPGAAGVSVTGHPGVTVMECWLREHETYTSTNEDGTKSKRVYDTWRVVVVAGNRVLMNEPADEVWRHGQHPYDRYVPYDLGEFWGLSLVEMLASTQESYNKVLAALQTHVELTGNPVLTEDTRAGLSRTMITNKPGQRLRKAAGAEVKWMDPPQINQAMPELLRFYLQRMEGVSGLSAVTKGGTPGGRNAQGVIDSLQESAFVRVRMALRNLEYTLRGAGSKKASLIAEFYTESRTVAILGDDGRKMSLFLRRRHFYLPDEEGGEPMKFVLLINAGSNSHTSRKVREDQAIMLFTLGAFDVPALLEALQVPNRQKISERVQQAMASGQMQPPGARQQQNRAA